MNISPKRVIVTEHVCTACGADRINVRHESFSETRIGGPSAEEAAERLANRLEAALDIIVDPLHREPLRQAIADVRAFINREAGVHPAREL
jgi:hypothetical protein